MSTERARQAPGQPTGGQFAATAGTDAGVNLTFEDPHPADYGRDFYIAADDLADSIAAHLPDGEEMDEARAAEAAAWAIDYHGKHAQWLHEETMALARSAHFGDGYDHDTDHLRDATVSEQEQAISRALEDKADGYSALRSAVRVSAQDRYGQLTEIAASQPASTYDQAKDVFTPGANIRVGYQLGNGSDYFEDVMVVSLRPHDHGFPGHEQGFRLVVMRPNGAVRDDLTGAPPINEFHRRQTVYAGPSGIDSRAQAVEALRARSQDEGERESVRRYCARAVEQIEAM